MSQKFSRTLSRQLIALPWLSALALSVVSGAVWAADPQGAWLTQDKDAALMIVACGDRLCGRVIWLESATDRSGSSRRDDENPDPAKRAERICGLMVMKDFTTAGSDRWTGNIYNPQDGKTYSATITAVSDTTLRIRAYIGTPLFGRSQTWTRVDKKTIDAMDYTCNRQRRG